jgi:hypothetical protein
MTLLTSIARRPGRPAGSGRRWTVVSGQSTLERSGIGTVAGEATGIGLAASLEAVVETFLATSMGRCIHSVRPKKFAM